MFQRMHDAYRILRQSVVFIYNLTQEVPSVEIFDPKKTCYETACDVVLSTAISDRVC